MAEDALRCCDVHAFSQGGQHFAHPSRGCFEAVERPVATVNKSTPCAIGRAGSFYGSGIALPIF
jgi:hypothetical protein